MRQWKAGAVCAMAAIGAGCASLPDARVQYYLPRADAVVAIERHVSCPNDVLHLRQTASVTTTYAADMARGPMTLDIKRLDRWYGGAELSVSLTTDGRLASINSMNQGDGAAWAKAAASVMGLAIQLGAVPAPVRAPSAAPPGPEDDDVKARRVLCQLAKAAKDGVAVYPYEAKLQFHDALADGDTHADRIALPRYHQAWRPAPTMHEPKGYDALDTLRGLLWLSAEPESDTAPSAPLAPCAKAVEAGRCPDYPVVRARVPVRYTVSLLEERGDHKPIGTVSVPQAGRLYDLPLPPPRLFGKQTAGLAFAPDGSLSSVSYGSTGGSAAVAEGSGALIDSATETSSERAARLNAQADEIKSEARLRRCLADPQACQ